MLAPWRPVRGKRAGTAGARQIKEHGGREDEGGVGARPDWPAGVGVDQGILLPLFCTCYSSNMAERSEVEERQGGRRSVRLRGSEMEAASLRQKKGERGGERKKGRTGFSSRRTRREETAAAAAASLSRGAGSGIPTRAALASRASLCRWPAALSRLLDS